MDQSYLPNIGVFHYYKVVYSFIKILTAKKTPRQLSMTTVIDSVDT